MVRTGHLHWGLTGPLQRGGLCHRAGSVPLRHHAGPVHLRLDAGPVPMVLEIRKYAGSERSCMIAGSYGLI